MRLGFSTPMPLGSRPASMGLSRPIARPGTRMATQPRFGNEWLAGAGLASLTAGLSASWFYVAHRLEQSALAKVQKAYAEEFPHQSPQDQLGFFKHLITANAVPTFAKPLRTIWALKTLPDSPLPMADKIRLALDGVRIDFKSVSIEAKASILTLAERVQKQDPALSSLMRQLFQVAPEEEEDFDDDYCRKSFSKSYLDTEVQILDALKRP